MLAVQALAGESEGELEAVRFSCWVNARLGYFEAESPYVSFDLR